MIISEELEQSLISAAVRGLIKLDVIPVSDLSPNGKAVCSAIEFLAAAKKKAPYSATSVLTAACDVAGADKTKLRPYLDKALKVDAGAESAEIMAKLHEQQALAEIVNIAGRQLSERAFDPNEFKQCFSIKKTTTLKPASELIVGDKLPDTPTGYSIPSLPSLTEASGGVMGVWAVGGKSKVGKSTLGVQISLEVPVPVLYYDMENGEQVLLYRIGKAFGGDVKKVKERTSRFYIRNHIKTLAQDLAAVPAPALIVIDSIQKLPTKLDQRRAGIDAWLAKFERLKEDGYTTLLISELNGFGGYKETGEIEHTVDFGMQLRRDGDLVIAHVVANRHRPHYGDIFAIERVNDWWIKESADPGQEDDGL